MKTVLVPVDTSGAVNNAQWTPSGLQVWYNGSLSGRIFHFEGKTLKAFYSDGIDQGGYSWHEVEGNTVDVIASKGVCDTPVKVNGVLVPLQRVVDEWLSEHDALDE